MVYLLLSIWPYLAAAAVIGVLAGVLGERLAHRAGEDETGRRG